MGRYLTSHSAAVHCTTRGRQCTAYAMDELSPFTLPPEQKDNDTPLRLNTRATTSTSAAAPLPPPVPPPPPPPPTHPNCSLLHSLSSSSSSSSLSTLLSIPPRCPTPGCVHHAAFASLCDERLHPPLYVLSCALCRATVYPCECCHQVCAHLVTSPAPPSPLSFSACAHCGFLAVVTPAVRRLLRLPPLLPLSSGVALSIQSAIDREAHVAAKTSAYLRAFQAFRRAVHSAKRGGREGKDGGESDTTDGGPDEQRLMPKVDESTLLRLREELLALSGSATAQRRPPSFAYGAAPGDRLPCGLPQLAVLQGLLSSRAADAAAAAAAPLSASLSAPSLSSFASAARAFIAALSDVRRAVRRVKHVWTVVQRVRRTYEEIDRTEPAALSRKRRRSVHNDGRVEEKERSAKDVERGVMGILLNALSCTLARDCSRLRRLIEPHWPLLSALNGLLTALYAALATDRRIAPTAGFSASSPSADDPLRPLLPQCREDDDADADDAADCDAVSVDVLCVTLCRCLYVRLAAALKEAEHWSAIAEEQPRQQEASSLVEGSRAVPCEGKADVDNAVMDDDALVAAIAMEV